MNSMENKRSNNSLLEDQNLINSLISKELMKEWEQHVIACPPTYFQSFPHKVIERIHEPTKTSIIYTFGKLSIAAVFIFVVAGLYFWLPKTNSEAALNSIALQEIPINEIDAYVNNYERVADADLQNEIISIGVNLEPTNLSNDSSN